MEPGRLQTARAFDDHAGSIGLRTDLLAQLLAFEIADILAVGDVIVGGFTDGSTGDLVMGEEQLASARIAAVDALSGDELLGPVEGLVDSGVHPGAEVAIATAQRSRSGLQFGDDHASGAGAGPGAEGPRLNEKN